MGASSVASRQPASEIQACTEAAVSRVLIGVTAAAMESSNCSRLRVELSEKLSSQLLSLSAAFRQLYRLQACLEKGGGRRNDVQPPAGNASVADEDSLFVNCACLESAKVHH